MVQPSDFTRINNDSNGNPRYVVHFLQCLPLGWHGYPWDISGKCSAAIDAMRPLGGKRYRGRDYGGGIVFQCYNLQSLCDKINAKLGGE